MYVYGGIDSSRSGSYLDVLNLEQGFWEKPSTTGPKPRGLRSSSSCLF